MEAANPILGNPLLLMAILLFLAILPRALRQREKTALDRMVERFEEEELKAPAEGKPDENGPEHEQTGHPKDPSLAYLMEDLPTSQETQEDADIPPLPVQEEVQEEKDELVKIVKEGVPISHNEAEDSSPVPKKKVKLIKQEISIAPDKNKVSSKKALSEPLKSKTRAQEQRSKTDSQAPPLSEHESEESDGNWVEAEIPGLIMDIPPAAERSESVPTFKASPKTKHQSEAEKPKKSPQKEKQSMRVKNIAPKSEEIKDSQPKKRVKTKADSPELKIEISESKPKLVEIKVPIVSHKDIVKKGAGQKKAKAPSAKAGGTQKTEPELAEVIPQRENLKTSPEKEKPKPFLLDLKYLEQEELETADPVAHKILPADMMDEVIARLNALQVDLENQMVSIPGELTPNENSINGNIRKDRAQDSLPDSEGTINEPSDKKEVSLEELDSFLFTATQRKNRE